jgi:preprotein translocase subunit SecG
MMALIIAIHVIACFLLISIVLIQQGRGGGLVESFSGVESMFGPKTNTFLTRATAVLSVMFFITCLSLAFLSSRQSRSLMADIKTREPVKQGSVESQAAKEALPQTPSTQGQAQPEASNTPQPPKAE